MFEILHNCPRQRVPHDPDVAEPIHTTDVNHGRGEHGDKDTADLLVADFLLAVLHIVALRSPPPSEVHGLLNRHLPEKAALAVRIAEAGQCVQTIDVEASVFSLAYFDW
jgi:hypothetical protein